MLVDLFGFVRPGLVSGYSANSFLLYPFVVDGRQPCQSLTSLSQNHALWQVRLLLTDFLHPDMKAFV